MFWLVQALLSVLNAEVLLSIYEDCVREALVGSERDYALLVALDSDAAHLRNLLDLFLHRLSVILLASLNLQLYSYNHLLLRFSSIARSISSPALLSLFALSSLPCFFPNCSFQSLPTKASSLLVCFLLFCWLFCFWLFIFSSYFATSSKALHVWPTSR